MRSFLSQCVALTALLGACATSDRAPDPGRPGQEAGPGPDIVVPPLPDLAVAFDGGAPADTGPTPDLPASPTDAPTGEVMPTGCPNAAPGVTRRTVQVDGRARTYVLSVPPQPGPVPLLFAWHGLGGSGMRFRASSGLEGAIDGGAVIVYPDGVPQPGFGLAPGWNLGPAGDVRLFDAILAEVSAMTCVDRARVFSTGHSFGGYMSNTLGCLRAGALRGIAPVAGGLPGAMCPGTPMAAWLAHAMNDPVVPFMAGEGAHAHWKRAAGCADGTRPVDPSPCVAHDGCSRPVHWCVHGQMHAWPAFAPAAIWKFFSELR